MQKDTIKKLLIADKENKDAVYLRESINTALKFDNSVIVRRLKEIQKITANEKENARLGSDPKKFIGRGYEGRFDMIDQYSLDWVVFYKYFLIQYSAVIKKDLEEKAVSFNIDNLCTENEALEYNYLTNNACSLNLYDWLKQQWDDMNFYAVNVAADLKDVQMNEFQDVGINSRKITRNAARKYYLYTSEQYDLLNTFNILNHFDVGDRTKEEESWENMYDKLNLYRLRFGHCLVSKSEDGKDLGLDDLYQWIIKQRFRYKIDNPILTKERIERLNSIGFVWSLQSSDLFPQLMGVYGEKKWKRVRDAIIYRKGLKKALRLYEDYMWPDEATDAESVTDNIKILNPPALVQATKEYKDSLLKLQKHITNHSLRNIDLHIRKFMDTPTPKKAYSKILQINTKTREGITCSKCDCSDTKVIDSRIDLRTGIVTRRRVCSSCDHKFNTKEKRE